MNEFLYQMPNEQRLFAMVILLLVIHFIVKFIINPIEKGFREYTWARRVTIALLIEFCSLFLIETIFLAAETDWNGWFAKKSHFPNLKLIDVFFLGLPIYILVIFSVMGLLSGLIILFYPFYRGELKEAKSENP